METEEEKRVREFQDKERAEQFLNYNKTPEFAQKSVNPFTKLKNAIVDNKEIVGAGVLGTGFGAMTGEAVNDAMHQDNISDLQAGQDALVQNKVDFDNLKLGELNNTEHHHYTNEVRNTNDEVLGILNNIDSTVPSGDNVGDVGVSKEAFADHLYDKHDDGKTIYDTLHPDTQLALQRAGVTDGYTNGSIDTFHDLSSQHEDIQDNIERMTKDRENAVETQNDFKDNAPGMQKANEQYIQQQTAKFNNSQQTQTQANQEYAASIANHAGSSDAAIASGAVAGAVAGAGAKKINDKVNGWDASKTGEALGQAGASTATSAYNAGANVQDKVNNWDASKTGEALGHAGAAGIAAGGTSASYIGNNIKNAYTNANKSYDLRTDSRKELDDIIVGEKQKEREDRGRAYQEDLKSSHDGTEMKSYNIPKPSFMAKDDQPLSQGEYNRRNNMQEIPSINANTPLNLDGNIEKPGDKRFNVTSHPIK